MAHGVLAPGGRLRTIMASSGSVVIHGAVFLVLASGSYLRVDALGEPAVKQARLMTFILPAVAAAAPSRGHHRQDADDDRRSTQPRPDESDPPETVQPQQIPEQPEGIRAETLPEQGTEGGIEGGVQDGVDGGVPGGDPRGVAGGVIDGDAGGTPDGLPALNAGGDLPVYLTGDVRPPERVTFVRPVYPEVARKARVEGKVILEIVVGRTGDVESVTILKPDPLFDQAAGEAVRMWKYQPALQGGRPVKVYLTVIVEFGLK